MKILHLIRYALLVVTATACRDYTAPDCPPSSQGCEVRFAKSVRVSSAGGTAPDEGPIVLDEPSNGSAVTAPEPATNSKIVFRDAAPCPEEQEPCVPSGDCFVASRRCDSSGTSRCVENPKPFRAPCGMGTGICSGDGTCVRASLSCVNEQIPGCGMVTIVGGTFRMGENSPYAAPNATPSLPGVSVSTLVMDAYEVTVARFRQFFDLDGEPRARSVRYPNGKELPTDWEEAPGKDSAVSNWSAAAGERESHPINGIPWTTAMAFCVWDGGRLPTEAEWEYAARGRAVKPDLHPGRSWPWGNSPPDCAVAHFNSCPGSPGTIDVTTQQQASGGIYALAGNVWEWTADAFQRYGSSCWPTHSPLSDPLCIDESAVAHVIRGGAYGATEAWLKSSNRLEGTRVGSELIGVRCVRDAVGPAASP